MENKILEASYPISFRSEDAEILGEHLKKRHSVVLIGMKRVGIFNFLKFFIYHPKASKTYIQDNQKHLFISVDLNDLVEKEIFAFWMLTLKRIFDSVESSSEFNTSTKKYVENLFLDSIQSKNLLILIDSVRKSVNKILEQGVLPTIFFLRFDRLMDYATRELVHNLEGIKSASNNKLSLVFTSYRRLDHLAPKAFDHTPLSLFTNNMYLKQITNQDLKIVSEADLKHYNLKLSLKIESALFEYIGKYIQYLQLALIILHEQKSNALKTPKELFNLLADDERITLQSEEIWESLTEKEKTALNNIVAGKKITQEQKDEAKYLWETSLVTKSDQVFSKLFEHFLLTKEHANNQQSVDLTKKEYALFNYLLSNIDQICEREAIIGSVWPQEEEFGVSDWAIDRLVARVRNKLKSQGSPYQIITAKTRGYKLINA